MLAEAPRSVLLKPDYVRQSCYHSSIAFNVLLVRAACVLRCVSLTLGALKYLLASVLACDNIKDNITGDRTDHSVGLGYKLFSDRSLQLARYHS